MLLFSPHLDYKLQGQRQNNILLTWDTEQIQWTVCLVLAYICLHIQFLFLNLLFRLIFWSNKGGPAEASLFQVLNNQQCTWSNDCAVGANMLWKGWQSQNLDNLCVNWTLGCSENNKTKQNTDATSATSHENFHSFSLDVMQPNSSLQPLHAPHPQI